MLWKCEIIRHIYCTDLPVEKKYNNSGAELKQ